MPNLDIDKVREGIHIAGGNTPYEQVKSKLERAEAKLAEYKSERWIVEDRLKDTIELQKIRNKKLEDKLAKANVELICKGLGSDVEQILKRGKLVAEREDLKDKLETTEQELADAKARIDQLINTLDFHGIPVPKELK